MARSTVISSKPLSWATPSRNLLVVAGTMFAGWLAASDAYGFHGDERYHVARAKPVE